MAFGTFPCSFTSLAFSITVNYPNLLITRGQREPAHYAKRKKVCINEYFTSLTRYQGTKLRLFCLKSKIFSNFFMARSIN